MSTSTKNQQKDNKTKPHDPLTTSSFAQKAGQKSAINSKTTTGSTQNVNQQKNYNSTTTTTSVQQKKQQVSSNQVNANRKSVRPDQQKAISSKNVTAAQTTRSTKRINEDLIDIQDEQQDVEGQNYQIEKKSIISSRQGKDSQNNLGTPNSVTINNDISSSAGPKNSQLLTSFSKKKSFELKSEEDDEEQLDDNLQQQPNAADHDQEEEDLYKDNMNNIADTDGQDIEDKSQHEEDEDDFLQLEQQVTSHREEGQTHKSSSNQQQLVKDRAKVDVQYDEDEEEKYEEENQSDKQEDQQRDTKNSQHKYQLNDNQLDEEQAQMDQSQNSVSHHTYDTEENNGLLYQSNHGGSTTKQTRKRRLSKVVEEQKQIVTTDAGAYTQHSRDVHSEYNDKHNESRASSKKDLKSNKSHRIHDQSRKSNQTNKSKKHHTKVENQSQGGGNSHRKQNNSKQIAKSKHNESLISQNDPQKLQQNQLEFNAQLQAQMMQQMMMFQQMGGVMPFQQQFQNQSLNSPQTQGAFNNMIPPQYNQFGNTMGGYPGMNPNFAMQNQQYYAQQMQMNNPQMYNNQGIMPQNPQNFNEQSLKQVQQIIKQQKEAGQLPPQLQELVDQQDQIKKLIEQIEQENQQIESELAKPDENQISQSNMAAVDLPLQQKIENRRNELILQRTQSEMNNQSHQAIHQPNQIDGMIQEQLNKSEDQQENMKKKDLILGQSQQQLDEDQMQEQQSQKQSVIDQVQQIQQTTNKDEQEFNEQDLVLKEIAFLAAKGHDPTPELEKENEELALELDQLRQIEREVYQKVMALEYENEILFGKSNSMDHSVQNYGKRLEELGKQLEELNAILRIKDHEMIEMTSDIHNLRMMKEGMRKEILFRKQRVDQLENNIRKIESGLDKAQFEQDELKRTLDQGTQEQSDSQNESSYLKSTLERLKMELRETQDFQNQTKMDVHDLNKRINELEAVLFANKNQIDRLRNENEQIKVDLSYNKATCDNQLEAYEKLNSYYQRQVQVNQDLDSYREKLLLNKNMQDLDNGNSQNQMQTDKPKSKKKAKHIDIDVTQEKVNQRHKNREENVDMESNRRNDFMPRNFKVPEENVSQKIKDVNALNSSKIKRILFDLTDPQDQSITGQKRRGVGGSQTRDFVNRNYVSQMTNILDWQDKAQGGQNNRSRGKPQNTKESQLDPFSSSNRTNINPKQSVNDLNRSAFENPNQFKGRFSVQEKFENNLMNKAAGKNKVNNQEPPIDPYDPNVSYKYGSSRGRGGITDNNMSQINNRDNQQGDDYNSSRYSTTAGRASALNNQQYLQESNIQSLKKDPAKINEMRDELNLFNQKREKLNAQLNKLSDKTREGRDQKEQIEVDLTDLNRKIGDIKLTLKKVDALKSQVL
eukprot:403340510